MLICGWSDAEGEFRETKSRKRGRQQEGEVECCRDVARRSQSESLGREWGGRGL